MFGKLAIKNFKVIGEKGIDLQLKPLTVLVGPNGSGKSSIFEALALLSANVKQYEFRLKGELVQFSSYEEIAHKHELGRWIVFEIQSPRGDGVRWEYKPDSGEEKETVIKGNREYIQAYLEGNRQSGFQLKLKVFDEQVKGSFGNALFKLDSMSMFSLLRTMAEYKISDELHMALNILDGIGTDLREKLFFLSALRGGVTPTASTGEFPKWVGREGQGVLPLLALISNTPLYDEAWAKIQNWAMQFGLSKLKAGIRGPNILAADYYDPQIKSTINLAFAGQGSRQTIPIIIQLFWAKPGSLIMIEEPEMSLHPEAQMKLGGLFADAIKENKQILVSTHSHFFLLALSQAIERGLKVDDIAVYHVTEETGGTKAALVKLSQRGYPLKWPPSYEKVERDLALNWSKGWSEK